jgi:hypothetical protein
MYFGYSALIGAMINCKCEHSLYGPWEQATLATGGTVI